ncbi:hypothetical protein F3Y22_tig00110549pilonHSYRG00001 [Hibiscus syriacus]|uniref:Uncharacterized protein n=1 Tax=Hibiscus syriacus TaxID=106335 RepID=A0A6A3A919_HIBSY|nr:uncharacterized protein LOC120131204 [Hibiscus syriacus]KAE8700940.1 hypothetical protein F3Y22_tig00110549pilonHSYRG00001 [Hibiscus syriacus]
MGETTTPSFTSIFSRDKKKALDNERAGTPSRKGMRRSASVGIFKAALGMLRTKSVGDLTVSDSKPDPVDVDSKVGQKGGDVGSESPVQPQSSQLSPPRPPPEKVILEIVPEPISGEERKEEAKAASLSPIVLASDVIRNESPREGIAKEKCGHHGDHEGGDEKIDIKAEEFIAQFYEQMRLQASNS